MLNKFLVIGLVVLGFICPAKAGSLERIGHTTLTPRHSNPDDRGMYAAAIDPTNGYAYFVGQYLFKLDITGNLPAQIGPALNTGQSVEAAIDPAAGYLYLPKGAIYRYALGAGTNAVSSAGSLTLSAGTVASIAIDNSDPNPANHYGYVVCTGAPTAQVAKVALATFTELGSISLNAGETNFVFCTVVDVSKGYAYYLARGAGVPQVVKVKFTPGANAPVRIGAVTLDTTNVFIDGASIDPRHGYAYYGTYDSDTNIPGRVYKVKLEDGDLAPTLVGHINLLPGEGRLAASVIDPDGGYVYFADDNTYPGHVYQLGLNGTNLPVEIGALPLQAGPSNSPPNGVTAGNVTTNSDGVLPFGEVFFRSAVFDPVRGFAYLGQDSRPNQVVKIQIALDMPMITHAVMLPGNTFQFSFTNTPGVAGTVLATTDLSLSVSNWSTLGTATEVSSGWFQFTDPQATNYPQRFYLIRSP
jgi:hypothetical protein